MDALKLLKQQHREAERLFRDVEEAPAARRAEVFDELARKLLSHMLVEQRVFYPAVQEVMADLVHEGYEEHHLARVEIDRILCAEPNDETLGAKLTTLKELIEHHVKEEEEDLFPKVEKKLDDEERAGVGGEMKALFEKLVERRPRTLLSRGDAVDVLADVEAA